MALWGCDCGFAKKNDGESVAALTCSRGHFAFRQPLIEPCRCKAWNGKSETLIVIRSRIDGQGNVPAVLNALEHDLDAVLAKGPDRFTQSLEPVQFLEVVLDHAAINFDNVGRYFGNAFVIGVICPEIVDRNRVAPCPKAINEMFHDRGVINGLFCDLTDDPVVLEA